MAAAAANYDGYSKVTKATKHELEIVISHDGEELLQVLVSKIVTSRGKISYSASFFALGEDGDMEGVNGVSDLDEFMVILERSLKNEFGMMARSLKADKKAKRQAFVNDIMEDVSRYFNTDEANLNSDENVGNYSSNAGSVSNMNSNSNSNSNRNNNNNNNNNSNNGSNYNSNSNSNSNNNRYNQQPAKRARMVGGTRSVKKSKKHNKTRRRVRRH